MTVVDAELAHDVSIAVEKTKTFWWTFLGTIALVIALVG